MNNLIYLVESGPFLDKVLTFTAEYSKNLGAMKDVLLGIPGALSFQINSNGNITVIKFGSKHAPEGFTKPGRTGLSRPRKGSEWETTIKNLNPLPNFDKLVTDAFGVPHTISYNNSKGHEGSAVIGWGINTCGLSFVDSVKGPFAVWMPDIMATTKKYQDEGYEVDETCANFTGEFEGCRQISEEEWDKLVKQAKAERAALAGSALQDSSDNAPPAYVVAADEFDPSECNMRFIEKVLELVQSANMSKEEVLQLVDYVFDRPAGKIKQTFGGVMVSLATLGIANNINIRADINIRAEGEYEFEMLSRPKPIPISNKPGV